MLTDAMLWRNMELKRKMQSMNIYFVNDFLTDYFGVNKCYIMNETLEKIKEDYYD